MEEKKNNNGLIWLVVILIILVLGLIGYIIYNNVKEDNKVDIVENTNTTTITTTTTESVNDDSNDDIEDKEFESKNVVLDFNKEKSNDVMEIGYDVLEPLTENKYKTNLEINNILVNGRAHYVKIKNYEPNDYDCKKSVDKVIYFDDKIVYEPYAEGCYLSGLSKIRLFKKQYIILEIGSQNGGWIHIFDEDGKELKSEKDMVVSIIDSMNNDSIIFTGWDKDIEEQVCKDNKYELQINNDVITYNLITKGENESCI